MFAKLHASSNKSARQTPIVATLLTCLVTAFSLVTTSCTKKVDDSDTTINAVLPVNLKGLDPIRANDLYSNTVIGQIYEGLLQYHYLKRPLELEGSLAEGMPTVSDNGLTHTFKIKKGVKFHDNAAFADGKGRELVASDFIYSWRRLADPKNASEGFWIFDGKIKGLNEWAAAVRDGKADYNTPIEGLSAPDSHTLVVKLTEPYFQLYYVLAMPFAAVVPKEAVDKYGDEIINNPVGTGPFMLEKASDWVRNSKITLKKNPTWRGEVYPSQGESTDQANGFLADAGKPMPFAQALVFSEIVEDAPRWQNFMKGQFESISIPNDNFESVVKKDNRKELTDEMKAKGIRLDIVPNLDVTYIGINMKDPILGKNKQLRQALALAQDSQTLIDKFYNGRGIPAQGPIPPGISSYQESYKSPYGTRNVEKAKELLKAAGFEGGKGLPEFTLDGLSDAKSRQQGEFFVQNMAAIGVKVRIQANTWPQFQDRIKTGKVQLFGIAWGADYPDAQNFYQLFYSKNASPGPNDSSYSNPEFDKIYEASLKLPPGAERDALYVKLRDIVVEDAPWIFNTHRLGYRTIHGWLNNFKYNDIQHDVYKYLRVDPKKRAELKAKL